MWVQCYWTCLWLSVWGSSNCGTDSHWMGSGCLGWKKMKWMGDFYLGKLMSRLYYFFSLSISFWILRSYSISVFLSLAYSTILSFLVDLMRPIIIINNSFNMCFESQYTCGQQRMTRSRHFEVCLTLKMCLR